MLDQGFTPQESYINGLIDKKIATLISDVNTLKNKAIQIVSKTDDNKAIKLSDGTMIIQGERVITRESTTKIRTYKEIFPDGYTFIDTDYRVLFGMSDNVTSGYHVGTTEYYKRENASMEVLIDMKDSGHYTTGYSYLCIGKWK